jgi:hypothetical protein
MHQSGGGGSPQRYISTNAQKKMGGLSWLAKASSAPAITALSRGDWGATEELISAEFRGASRKQANRGLRPVQRELLLAVPRPPRGGRAEFRYCMYVRRVVLLMSKGSRAVRWD